MKVGEGHALLIGSQVPPLTGTDHDVQVMERVLHARGFACDVVIGSRASRDGMVAAIARLQNAARGGPVVFYYTGHGGQTPNPDHGAHPAQPHTLQYLVPVDGRPVFSEELSTWARALRTCSDNVTFILDCCFSGQLVKGPRPFPELDARIKVTHLRDDVVIALHRDLGDIGRDLAVHPPDIVRVFAAAENEPALEIRLWKEPGYDDGAAGGLLTAALRRALDGETIPVNWRAFIRWAREWMKGYTRTHRPDVDGPLRRALFGTTEVEEPPGLAFFRQDRIPHVRAGSLHGVQVGDEYTVSGLGLDGRIVSAALRVTEVFTDHARVEVSPLEATARIPLGTPAHTVRCSAARRSVVLRGNEGAIENLRRQVAESPYVIESNSDDGAIAAVQLRDGALLITDRLAAVEAHLPGEDAMATLGYLARAAAVRALGAPPGAALAAPHRVLWGRVIGGRQGPALPHHGATIHAGERYWIEIANLSKVALYYAVLDIGFLGEVSLMTVATGGLYLPAGDRVVIGQDSRGTLVGGTLSWADEIDGSCGLERFVVIVADRQVDFSGFVTRSTASWSDGVPVYVDDDMAKAAVDQVCLAVYHIELSLLRSPCAAG
ncbi:MAG: caspase family protein [Deltaproteobacteria bacterium]|nr:MAG: caspase family protein [Deltaproteobacteria bacterium]TMQ19817.1 MAG: caspase family protein [Deltaproteobacteria bacterium]